MSDRQLLIVHPECVPATGLRLRGEVAAAELELVDSERLAVAGPVDFDLDVNLVRGGLLVRGSLAVPLDCACDRCLERYSLPLAVPAVTHYYENVDNHDIDLTNDLREDILIDFPQHLVCKPECRGLCPVCGGSLNVDPCQCEHQEPESETPWQALDGLRTTDR